MIIKTLPDAPHSINELLQRVENIAGMTIGDLAEQYSFSTPKNLLKEKGWIGQLIELVLGATAGSRPEPDFPALGVELKTLPISYSGKPLETTFVSVVPLINLQGLTWHNSVVKKKLNLVLWLPILAERDIPPKQRIIGTGFLWQPNAQQTTLLQQDWEQQIEMIALGEIGQINGKLGQVLQIRPKAANAKALTNVMGPEGKIIQTLPRGFYLKTSFTQQILAQQFSN